jgi:phage gp29-like protein
MARRPLTRPARELQVRSWTEWDSLALVKAALRDLEAGIFNRAAEVLDAMGRDDRIRGVMNARFRGLLKLPFSMEEQGDARRASAVAKEVNQDYAKLAPESSLVELAQWGHGLGVGIAENVWERKETRWRNLIRVWHPKFLRWDIELEKYVLQTREGPRVVEGGDGQWILFTPYGERRGWMSSLVRALATPWLVRQWAFRDAARHSEVWGSPQRKARVPFGAKEEEKDKFVDAVAQIGADSTIVIPGYVGPNGEKYDVELLEAMSQGAPFITLMDKSEACIAIAVLGNNLSTEVQGGSFAAAKVHENVTSDIIASDAELLSTCLREQHLAPYCAVNFGDPELAPYPRWDTEEPEDQKTRGESLKAIGDGIASLQATGAQPDVDAILEDAEIPTTGKAGPPPPKPAAAPAPDAGGKPQDPGDLKPKPTQKPAAAALEAPTRAEIAGQLFVDDLVEKTKAAFAELHGVDVAELQRIVKAAQSFDELRKGLAPFLAKMSWERKAALLERAFILAELNGSHAVLESL